MKDSSLREIPFNGVRLRFDSNKSFDDVLSSLLADVGDKPLLINEVAANSESWDSYKKEIESHVGPSGFSLFATIDHGAWIKKVGFAFTLARIAGVLTDDHQSAAASVARLFSA